MKKYRHRASGREVSAGKASEWYGKQVMYTVYDYYRDGEGTASTRLTEGDFEALFEPIEEYCCDNFKWHVERGLFAKDDAGKWASWLYCSNRRCPDGLPRVKSPIKYCQFCGKKLEGGRSK